MIIRAALFAVSLGFLTACGDKQADQSLDAQLPAKAVYLISPVNGQTLRSPFTVKFGLKGMGVAPAGVQKENTGHHHLLINLEQLPDLTTSLPSTDQVRHFGKGQTQTDLSLPPGEHTLQLLLGDFAHRPHAEPLLSKRITIQVVE